VCDIVNHSFGKHEVPISDEVLAALDLLRHYLYREVYTNPIVKREADRSRHVVSELFRYFCGHHNDMPREFQLDPREEGVERRVADYIAGMTDTFATRLFEELFVPKAWPV
jgi:dGTPase